MTRISESNPSIDTAAFFPPDEERLTPEQIDALIFEREPLLLNAQAFGGRLAKGPRRRRHRFHAALSGYSDRLGKGHRPDGRRFNVGPCSVYLLVHAYAPRFKIGLSNDPWIRGHSLQEASFIQWDRSLQVVLPSKSRAAQVESMLHRALAAFRLNFKLHEGAAWDGSTEWFNQSGFRHAVNLLQVTPTSGERSEPALLLPVLQRSLLVPEGEAPSTGETHKAKVTNTTEPRVVIPNALIRFRDAGRFNLELIDTIVDVMTMLGWKYRVRVVQAPSGGQQIHCHGLARNGCDETREDRYRATNTDLWCFHTDSCDAKRRVVPLVGLMHWPPSMPGTVVMEVNDLRVIRRLPEGRQVVQAWQGLCQRLNEQGQ